MFDERFRFLRRTAAMRYTVIGEHKLVALLRERLGLSKNDIGDDDVLRLTEGTLGRSLAEIEIEHPYLRDCVETTRARMLSSIESLINNIMA